MKKYFIIAVTLLVTTEVAICSSWQGIPSYDYDFSDHPEQPPWSWFTFPGFENQPDNHDWDDKPTPKPDMNDWWNRDPNGRPPGSGPIDTTRGPNRDWWKPINTQRPPVLNYNMQACIASCPVPRAYDPVCGTDNVTYRTIGQLYCARQCGLAVAVSARTECFGGNNYITPKAPNTAVTKPTISTTVTNRPNTVPTSPRTFTGDWDRPNTVRTTPRTFTGDWDRPNTVPTTPRTFTGDWDRPNTVPTTPRTFTGDWDRPNTVPTAPTTVTKDWDRPNTTSATPSLTDINICITTCSKSSVNRTVCGTDGITYDNEEHIFCAQLCGKAVTMTRFSSCPEIIVNGTGQPGLTTQPPLPSPTTRQPSDVIDCIRSCPIPPGYNPVCGSNGLTYTNDEHLRCAQRCGVQVTMTRLGPCRGGDNNGNGNGNPRRTTQSPLPSPTTRQPSDVIDCIRSCAIPPGYNPVCGSNGLTYSNDGHLRCAQRCGVQVTITRLGPCPGGDSNGNGNGNPRWTTQSPLPSPTTRQPTDIIDCMRSCLIPPGYSPVCGSNGRTYSNDGHLRCAQRCGVQVTITRLGACPGGDNNGNGNPGWTTQSPLPSPTTRQPTDIIDCIRSCSIPPGYSPVCGSNGRTYSNDGHLHCAQRCGVQVTIARLGACPGGDNNGKGNPRWTTKSPPPNTTPRQPSDIIDCIRSCQITNEYNPVCGSNGVTYTNDGHLRCAQQCGIEVTVTRLGPCLGGDNNGKGNPGSTTTAPFPSTTARLPYDVIDCIRSCLVTQEYIPVCGSDGVTYTNEGRLRCATDCGIDVSLRQRSPCPDLPNNGNGGSATLPPYGRETTISPAIRDCIRNCPVTPEYNPVCGTDGVTYTNIGRLECARNCGVAVNLRRMAGCAVPQMTTQPTFGNNGGLPNPLLIEPNKDGKPPQATALPSDVLDSIFTDAPTTEEADVSVDPRFNSQGRTFVTQK